MRILLAVFTASGLSLGMLTSSLVCPRASAQKPPVDLEKMFQANPTSKAIRQALAEQMLLKGNNDRVVELLNSYTDQLTLTGFLTLAMAYSNKKDYVNEVRVLGLLAAKDESNFRWQMLMAQANLKGAAVETNAERKRDLTTAGIQKLRATLQLQKGYKPAYDLLLTTLLFNKIHNEAREVIMEGISRYGERPELFREICRLDSTDGFLDQAVDNCRAAISSAPSYPDNYVYLAQSLFDQDETEQAERNLVSAAKRFPTSEFVQWAAGMLFFKKKNFAVASRYFGAAVKLQPTSGRAQFGLAQALFESGSEQASLDHFIKACQADRTTSEVFLAAGGRLKQKSNYKLGEEFVRKANTSCH
jgi:tetratricopeptide (TPR) repeat protein